MMLKHNTRATNKAYATVGIVAVAVLLSAALVVPSSNAYAISQNGSNRSGDSSFFSLFFSLFGTFLGNQPSTTSTVNNADDQGDAKGKGDVNGKAVGGGDEKNEQSDRKQLKDQKEDNPHDKNKCKPNKHGKYNKDCTEDQNGQ